MVVVVVSGIIPRMVLAGLTVIEHVNILVPSRVGILTVAAFLVLEGIF
jgi:hypothetical protein